MNKLIIKTENMSENTCNKILKQAVKCKSISIINKLKNCGKYIDHQDEYGDTLFTSCYNIDIMKYVLSNGANINHQNKCGNTVLHNVASQCYNESKNCSIMNFLLDSGARTDIKNDKGYIALEYAYQDN